MTTSKLIKKAFKTLKISSWFHIGFWKYLLEKADKPRYCSRWHRFWCRASGHPEGPWWYNMGGYEPDMTCKGCGDTL